MNFFRHYYRMPDKLERNENLGKCPSWRNVTTRLELIRNIIQRFFFLPPILGSMFSGPVSYTCFSILSSGQTDIRSSQYCSGQPQMWCRSKHLLFTHTLISAVQELFIAWTTVLDKWLCLSVFIYCTYIGLINIKYKRDGHGNLRVELGETTGMSGRCSASGMSVLPPDSR